ncbi:MAG: HslU--HslV peptidase proteolytic subunit, partial [Burkholderiales bacterium]
MQYTSSSLPSWHGTTILAVRKNGQSVIGADGQVSLGNTIIKSSAKKLRRLCNGSIVAGFACS